MASKKQTGLGRGLEALLGPKVSEFSQAADALSSARDDDDLVRQLLAHLLILVLKTARSGEFAQGSLNLVDACGVSLDPGCATLKFDPCHRVSLLIIEFDRNERQIIDIQRRQIKPHLAKARAREVQQIVN